jgi:DNA polymerase I-like protein with 3'-5' exonuclease and polymerase domains
MYYNTKVITSIRTVGFIDNDLLLHELVHDPMCQKVAGEVLLYACLVPIIEQQLNERKLWQYYMTIEMPALIVTLQMQLNGIYIDRNELHDTRDHLLVRHGLFMFVLLIVLV